MGATLPIIDIGPYLTKDADPAARAQVSKQLHEACVKYGFFYLDLSKFVDPSTPEELVNLGRQFFSLPQDEKNKIGLIHQDGARGYQRLKENVTNGKADNHEGLDFYKPVDNPDKTKPLWGENQWPAAIPEFEPKFTAWTNKMKELGIIVMEAMAVGLGMTAEEWQELSNQINDSFWVMRVIGYPPLPNDDDGFSCGAHKDYGCLTFLYADATKNALQVFQPGPAPEDADKNVTAGLPDEAGSENGHWILADPIPGCVVCNVGEMWEIWSNGLYKSTLHRVIHRSSNYRISIPFFFEANFNAYVKPLAAAERITERENKKPEKEIKPVVYGDFLMSKVANNFANPGKKREKY